MTGTISGGCTAEPAAKATAAASKGWLTIALSSLTPLWLTSSVFPSSYLTSPATIVGHLWIGRSHLTSPAILQATSGRQVLPLKSCYYRRLPLDRKVLPYKSCYIVGYFWTEGPTLQVLPLSQATSGSEGPTSQVLLYRRPLLDQRVLPLGRSYLTSPATIAGYL
ncbi:hypothetical protein BT67DRAFT_99180 [Trichocladium antarcticum]|uniref:Uncharacterized protein n=1 Tax=Trichocladium antarcticum TaxID=1450529 RepID=A0AAN6ZGP7_9PEZI|nr:hypothetical protein BT67DRAFT_99180 [Trichocladium antarcticum]